MNLILRLKVCTAIILFNTTLTAQLRPTAIFGDYNTFWTSQNNSGTYVTAQDTNNLTAFTLGSVTYATGANNASLASHGIAFVNENYKAFPSSIPITTTATNFLIGTPRYLNGVLQDQNNRPSLSCDTSLGFWLRDGSNGLDLSTAVFNIPKQNLSFNVDILAEINPTCITDEIPDIIVTQVGAPSTSFDIFKFTDSQGNTIGIEKDVNFSSAMATPSGTALWSFYYAGQCPHTYNSGGGFSGTTRDIRILTFKLSDFGITAENFISATKFVQVLSGDSDVAFSAYSTNSMNLYCLENGVTTGTALDTKTGITSLGRAGTEADNWPMVRKGGYLALESNNKPFVPTRLSTVQLVNITNPVEGMMVYDTTENCLKVFVSTVVGWKCFNKKTCQ